MPWEETAPRRLGEHRIALPALGARHGHPAFVSNTSHLLWMAEALARSATTSPDALLAQLADAQAHRVHAFHAWQLVNDLLTTLDGDGKRLVLASLYARS
ncbi:MAG: hypothetical protein EON58_13560 [Alphaproteobacteria bacterium]|nr:MAG: hypothetical protein EON58_13560 [Alphaproteobacteria bacterium]